jgi:hypothetical protein
MSNRFIWLLSLWLPACHSAPSQPVPISGGSADILALAGEWDGTYEATDGTREGVIDFHLQAGSDTAFGDVMMVPRGREQALAPEGRTSPEAREAMPPRLLYIRFVRIAGGEVSGELERHRDPDCACVLRTVFRGRLVADTLAGRYLSRAEEGGVQREGRWRATRKPASR